MLKVDEDSLRKVSENEDLISFIENDSRKIVTRNIQANCMELVVECSDIQNTEDLRDLVESGQVKVMIGEAVHKVVPTYTVGDIEVGKDKDSYRKQIICFAWKLNQGKLTHLYIYRIYILAGSITNPIIN